MEDHPCHWMAKRAMADFIFFFWGCFVLCFFLVFLLPFCAVIVIGQNEKNGRKEVTVAFVSQRDHFEKSNPPKVVVSVCGVHSSVTSRLNLGGCCGLTSSADFAFRLNDDEG